MEIHQFTARDAPQYRSTTTFCRVVIIFGSAHFQYPKQYPIDVICEDATY